MTTVAKAQEIAASLPVIPGQVIQGPVEIMLAFMALNELEFIKPPSLGYGIVGHKKDGANMALKETLGHMLERSTRNGRPERMTLLKGLEVAIWDQGSGQIALQLARENVFPGRKEWQTVVKYLPVQVIASEPQQLFHEKRFYLKGILQRVEGEK